MGTARNAIPTAETLLRENLVDAARVGWTNRLIDLSRRNNLLYYRPLVSGTLEVPVSSELMEFLRVGKSVPVIDFFLSEPANINCLRAISRKGLENLEEKGLSTLYLALGKCTWTSDDGGRDPVAPALLIPISLKLKGQDIRATEIEIGGEPEVNPVLLHILNKELNVSISADELRGRFSPFLDSEFQGIAEDQAAADLDAVLDELNAVAGKVPGFKAEQFAVVGNFSFQKLAMVRDLEKRRDELLANEIVAAIAGDATARRNLGSRQIEVDPAILDAVPPDNEFAVLEADSSQQCAIAGIASGQSAVVHGPPGTGKSQTIANLIATLTANGKKVLFVAEKRAALEVVMKRLTDVGLDHLAIDLHGAEQTPKKVMDRVARTLNTVREATKPLTEEVHAQFSDRRVKLNQHDARMHKTFAPTQQTVYSMQGALLRLPSNLTSPLRWRGPDLLEITPERSKRILDLLAEAAGFETLFNRTDPSPWCGVELHDGQATQSAVDLAFRLAYEELPDLKASLEQLCQSAGLRLPKTFAQVDDVLMLLGDANLILASYQPDVFQESGQLVSSLTPGHGQGLKGVWYRLTSKEYKSAHLRAVAFRNGVRARGKIIREELAGTATAWSLWQRWCMPGATPRAIQDTAACERARQKVKVDLAALKTICKSNWGAIEISEVIEKVSALASDNTTPYRVRRLCEIERELYSLGAQRLLDDIRSSNRPSKHWAPLFRYVWLKSTLDMAAINDPSVRAFVGATHNGYVEDFKRLDTARLELAAKRVRRIHAENTIAAMNKFPIQETLIRSEAAKSRRHKPLRKIFAEAKDVLTAVCPCWMASPLSVCQLITTTGTFDYVIFDEASQVLAEDAVPAILRGRHVIVAGDNKQLPPTTFFASAEEDDEENDEATAYESLLDMMIPFVKGFYLNWHYRSRDEALISFSNHHIYDDRLVTFPGPGGGKAISHVFVDYIPSGDGQEESSGGEVKKVVELVLSHARSAPNRTLGVITMGIKHANRIQGVLDTEMARYPELAEFFDTGRSERFFVKNLERVQGDERDVIILSVGYGKDRAGNLPLRFGPILSAGGRRRLNVAVTRARERMIVVSSFLHSDINSTQVRPGTGLEFLKNYIEYASSGGTYLFHGELTNEPMNDFEAEVYDTLTSQGVGLVPQLGSSKFRIDLAACHPRKPGKFVLAIECDGATYHSSYTARDRDRLRQQQLENLGWRFHRIWSTDWFMRKDEEIKRAVQAFKSAVELSDKEKTARPTPLRIRTEEPNTGPIEAPPTRRTPAHAPIPQRASIAEYTPWELQTLLRWVRSDGKLRTNDELAEEMFAALPFARRGSKIEAALRRAIAKG
jgi:very-short-patch-repair endonuclease